MPALGRGEMPGASFMMRGTITVCLIFRRDANPDADRFRQNMFGRCSLHGDTVINVITLDKKDIAANASFSYIEMMKKKIDVSEGGLAAFAKQYRLNTGKNRAQVARELNVARQAVIYAEDFPEKSFFKLRKRMIETYSPYKVIGPVLWLEEGKKKSVEVQ